MPDFASLSLPLLIALFLGMAALVWIAGDRLAVYAAELADRTGLNQAVVGVILLGGATSLPEIATSGVATLAGNPGMAVNNLLGGVAFQVVVLAIADFFTRRGALTTQVPGPRVMVNAVVCILLLSIAAVGATVGEVALPFGLGLFALLTAMAYVGSLWMLGQGGAALGWKPARPMQLEPRTEEGSKLSNGRLALLSAIAALAILCAGTVLTLCAEEIARKAGIDLGIAGLTFLAVATSLPEISTAIAAVRLGRAELAIGDVLGGNMFDIALLLLVDVLYRGGLALDQADQRSIAMALTAIFLTGLLLLGLIERRNKRFLRLGYDSIAILVTYVGVTAAIILGGSG